MMMMLQRERAPDLKLPKMIIEVRIPSIFVENVTLLSRSFFFFSGLVEDVGQMTSAAVLAVEMGSHKDASSALLVGTLTAKASDFSVLVDLVVLEDRKLDQLLLVLNLLGSGKGLLLTLLATTSQAEDKMEGGLLLDVIVGQSTSILELLAHKEQTLLIGRNTLLVLDLSFDILDPM